MRSVGLIGVGVMGRVIIPRIRDAGHELHVFDISREALEKVARFGLSAAGSPESVAERTEVVLMSLPGPMQVEEVVAGPGGLLAGAWSGTVIVDLSTVDPHTSERMAAVAAEKEVGYLDAPVLGRPTAVGEWTLPVGGNPEHLDRCLHILKLFARNVVHIGTPGSGNKVKLLNQLMFSAINGMTAEMMAVAEKIGISKALLYETISASQAVTVSSLFKELGEKIVTDDYEDPTFHIDLLTKDTALAIEMAREVKAAPLIAEAIQQMNKLAQSRGFGSKDTSEMWKIWRDIPYTDSPVIRQVGDEV